MADQIEGRNPVVECLARKQRAVKRVWLDGGAKPDRRVTRILELAREAGVPVERVDRQELDRRAQGRVHNGVIAMADSLPQWTTRSLLEAVHARGEDPFLLVADELQYEHNLGAILRSGLGFGLHGVVIPTRRGADVTPVVSRVSMGGVEAVPVVREAMHAALKHVRDAGVRIVGADMDGAPIHSLDLRGPVALVMGGEGRGLTDVVRAKCDVIAAIPLNGDVESLNVSVAASILMYEKQRQESMGR